MKIINYLQRWLTARIIEDEMETETRRSNDEIRLEPKNLEGHPEVLTHEYKNTKVAFFEFR